MSGNDSFRPDPALAAGIRRAEELFANGDPPNMTLHPIQVVDLEALVSKLTEAQRVALIDGLARYTDPNTVRALRRKGLVESRSTMLTMSGLTVQAALSALPQSGDKI